MSELRYERKFTSEVLTRRELEQLLRTHPALFSPIYQRRFINNIYFDSGDLRAVSETLDGVSRREKLRIRWYGDFLGTAERPVLERKTKQGFVVGKASWPLPRLEIGPSLRARDVAAALGAARLPRLTALRIAARRPVLFNRYARTYHLSADGRFRVTIDDALRYRPFRPLGGAFRPWDSQPGLLVLELKYAREDDEEAAKIAQHLPLRVSRNSKYVSGMARVYPSVEL